MRLGFFPNLTHAQAVLGTTSGEFAAAVAPAAFKSQQFNAGPGLIEALFSDAHEQTSYQQLADRLGVPMNSLGPTRARCLSRLRHLLTAAGYGP